MGEGSGLGTKRALYKNKMNVVRCNMTSNEFQTNRGIRQVYKPEFNSFYSGIGKGLRLIPTQFTILAYPGDLVVFGNNRKNFYFNLRVLRDYLKEVNMEINSKQIMHMGRRTKQGDCVIRLDGT